MAEAGRRGPGCAVREQGEQEASPLDQSWLLLHQNEQGHIVEEKDGRCVSDGGGKREGKAKRPTELFEKGSMVEVKGYGYGVVQWMGELEGRNTAGVEREEAQMRLQRERKEIGEAQRKLEQEKEKAQRELRDLKLRIAEAERKRRERPKPQFPCQQQKSVAVVSPTTAEAKAIISKPEENCLDHGGERRGVQQYPGEGKPRERANASARDLQAKQHHAEKETSFIDKHTHTDSKPQLPDVATHIDLENTWVCNYCTQLNPDTHTHCDVCKSPDPRRSWLCSRCQNTNPDSLPQCKNCRKLKETLV